MVLAGAGGQTRGGEHRLGLASLSAGSIVRICNAGSLLTPPGICRPPGKSGVRESPSQVQRF